MSTRSGISDHTLVEVFERVYQIRRRAVPDHQAQREALYTAFRLTGIFDRDQAEEAADEILGPLRSPVELESTANELS